MRSLAGLREFLLHGPAEGAGARLERWCRGNALGWAFDGDTDDVRLDASITGFDMTHLLDYEEVCAPAAAYLLHRVASVVDGRRFVMSCDEFRAYLLNPMFAAVVDRFLLTVRKNNGMLIPVSYTHLDVYKRQLCNWGQGFDDTALRDRVVLALVDELSQLDTKRGQIGKLALHLIKVEPSDPVNLGARLGAIVRKAQQLPHLVQ